MLVSRLIFKKPSLNIRNITSLRRFNNISIRLFSSSPEIDSTTKISDAKPSFIQKVKDIYNRKAKRAAENLDISQLEAFADFCRSLEFIDNDKSHPIYKIAINLRNTILADDSRDLDQMLLLVQGKIKDLNTTYEKDINSYFKAKNENSDNKLLFQKAQTLLRILGLRNYLQTLAKLIETKEIVFSSNYKYLLAQIVDCHLLGSGAEKISRK